MDTHDTRAGPGAQKGEQGSPCKTALPPEQPPARDSSFSYANASGGDLPTAPAQDSTDLTGAGYDGASGGVPEALPYGADADWHEVDGKLTRVVIRRVPDGGRLSRFISNLLLDGDVGGPPLDDHDGLSGVREPLPVPPCAGGPAVAVAVPEEYREPVLV